MFSFVAQIEPEVKRLLLLPGLTTAVLLPVVRWHVCVMVFVFSCSVNLRESPLSPAAPLLNAEEECATLSLSFFFQVRPTHR